MYYVLCMYGAAARRAAAEERFWRRLFREEQQLPEARAQMFHMLRELPWLAPAVANNLVNLAVFATFADLAKLAKAERNPCKF